MATTDKQIAMVEKAIQGVTVAMLAINAFFLIRALDTLDVVVDNVADLKTRVSVVEYALERDQK